MGKNSTTHVRIRIRDLNYVRKEFGSENIVDSEALNELITIHKAMVRHDIKSFKFLRNKLLSKDKKDKNNTK